MDAWASPLGSVGALGSATVYSTQGPGTMPSAPHAAVSANTHVNTHYDAAKPLSREERILFIKMEEMLADMEATETGRGKKWLNVQPCVVAANKALMQHAVEQEDRLANLERLLPEIQRNLGVLANDTRLKEERHRLEQEEHAAQVGELRTCCLQLRDELTTCESERKSLRELVKMLCDRVSVLESELAASIQGAGCQNGGVCRSDEVEDAACAAVQSRRPLESQQEQPPARAREINRRPLRKAVVRDGDIKQGNNEASSGMFADSQGASPDRVGASALLVADLHERVLEEVAQLRAQWEEYFKRRKRSSRHSSTRGLASDDNDDDDDDAVDIYTPRPRAPQLPTGTTTPRRGCTPALFPASIDFVLFPPQKARWFWSGGQSSHFSSATQCRPHQRRQASVEAGGRGAAVTAASPALAWDTVRLHDNRSGCWYSAGSWPCEMLSSPPRPKGQMDRNGCVRSGCRGNKETLLGEEYWDAARAWGCFEWTRPSAIRVARAGVYRFTVTLLTDCPTTGVADDDGGHISVTSECRRRTPSPSSMGGMRAPTLALYVDNSRVVTAVPSSSSPSSLLLLSACDECHCDGGDGPGKRHRFGGQGRDSPTPRLRPCCAPAQLASYTTSEYCHLREGATLQVRCHNFHNTKATVEAFLELEYIV